MLYKNRIVNESVVSALNVNKNSSGLFKIIALILTALLTVIVLILGFYSYVVLFLANPVIPDLTTNPQKAIGLDYEEIRFTSKDKNHFLDGWYIPANSDKTIIFSHGYGENREQSWVHIYDLVQSLHRQKYNILMFDYGFVSPNLLITGGARETEELLGAVEAAKERGAAQIFVWGFSMGAGTALQVALITQDINAMILDSTFVLSTDSLYQNLQQHIDLPRFPSIPLIQLLFPVISGTAFNDNSYNQIVSSTYSTPIFFIHSKQDKKAPFHVISEIYANQTNNPLSKLWTLPNGRHELIFRQNKKEYLKRTLTFLNGVGSP